ncbi:proline--tRNA ligase, chloroplastic/mitochondrial-like [Olea europaea var. sylvestris]|uniref:proline--tRNA ligase, chloroplastic/mitochondrial-like n=1 Tax=Olea europaea var. sylvestris TaxID=158386 RepID=UPI000C1CF5DA|nr:proline--tRNA ligase, chloroplastic/mitochondrial-like [Olea europaea var. sylvestris]XP_022887081.1 proline--tRNA ligase, chloroplastic/mitochondrial-like [Olea europaea var. sylvestris]XP_022887082.1 proline--tRNA ligase, chloroplastic/mitochondrial-like [Olea europaea var. sylvestris]
MGVLRLPSLTSLFTSSSSAASIPRRYLPLPLRRHSTANCSAQSSTAEKELSSTSELEGPPKLKVQQDKDRLITPRSQDFNAWYLDIIANAELADYGPVRGTMVIRPYGYAIWEAIQEYLNVKFKETGHSNMYFPQFIPYSFIEKEASHVEGFSPELALVTIGGGKELEEKLVVRPTSETIVNHMFTQWIHSYRDLPLLINQWANVTRWEMRTKPFVRTLEFLWQEGHTAHATPEEAEMEALQMIDVYTKFAYEQAAIPVIAGRKSKVETFAGASKTYTIEAMMGDRKALQAGTSHNLGQNFSRAFGTQFTDENGQREHVWQTSWAISTRFVGGIIMAHGDDTGLMLPPKLAPVQVIIVPIWKKADERTGILDAASSVKEILQAAGIKAKIDDSEQRTPGWKFNFWEMKGVPLRIEIGPRDVSSGSVVVCRRDIPGKQGKVFGISMESSSLVPYVKDKLDEIQSTLLGLAMSFRDSNIVDVLSYAELKEAIAQGKWARGPWSASDSEELKVKEETGATIRCFPFEQPQGTKKCLMTGNPADEVAIFAKSY